MGQSASNAGGWAITRICAISSLCASSTTRRGTHRHTAPRAVGLCRCRSWATPSPARASSACPSWSRRARRSVPRRWRTRRSSRRHRASCQSRSWRRNSPTSSKGIGTGRWWTSGTTCSPSSSPTRPCCEWRRAVASCTSPSTTSWQRSRKLFWRLPRPKSCRMCGSNFGECHPSIAAWTVSWRGL